MIPRVTKLDALARRHPAFRALLQPALEALRELEIEQDAHQVSESSRNS